MMQSLWFVFVVCLVLPIHGDLLTASDVFPMRGRNGDMDKSFGKVDQLQRRKTENEIRDSEEYVTMEEYIQTQMELATMFDEVYSNSVQWIITQYPVAFIGHITSNFNVGDDHVVRFNGNIPLNIGDAFDGEKFTCPYKGMYLFSVQVDDLLDIVLTKKDMVEFIDRTKLEYLTSIILCEKGEEVRVQSKKTGDHGHYNTPTFQGILLKMTP